MPSRWLINLSLLGIAGLLTFLVIFEPGLEKPVALPPFTALNSDQIQHIKIERTGKATIALERDAQKQWQLTAPLALPANTFKVNNLLGLLSEQDYQQLDAKQLDLATVKLDVPEIRLHFDQLTLALGDNSPVNRQQRYVQRADKPEIVFLLPDNSQHFLNAEPVGFVSFAPLGPDPKIVELTLPNYHLILKEGSWHLASTRFSAEEINSSADALTTLVDQWRYVQAMNVQVYDDKQTATEEDELTTTEIVEVRLKDQDTSLRFLITATTPDLMLARPDKGVQYQISKEQIDKLLHLPKQSVETEASASAQEIPASADEANTQEE